jgi:signal transduction histidine kinase
MTQQSSASEASAREALARETAAREPLLELYDALAQHQLRDAGAEVAAAIAHAVGTPLNVISGRAELIRHDPANALAQVARIEEQVKKLAMGLRQLVDYLAVPDPRAPQRPASVSKRTPADGTPPEARGAAPARAASPPRPPAEPSLEVPGEIVVVDARAVLDDVLALTESLAGASGVEVVADVDALKGARVERWHTLGTLNSLVSCAVRHVASRAKKGDNCQEHSRQESSGRAAPVRVRIGGGIASQGVVFELIVPGLPMIEGWQLEHFQARPPVTECSEFYRTMSICAAVVRGHGGRLLIESAPSGEAIVIRFSCRNEAAPP